MRPLSIGLACAVLCLGGCASFLSQSGPGRSAVIDQAAPLDPQASGTPPAKALPYRLVRLDATAAAAFNGDDAVPRFGEDLVGAKASGGLLGVGDAVSLTVFEAAAGGLFIPSEAGSRNGNFITLPTQEIDGSGRISVPFAGAVHAAGLTPSAVEHEIDRRLSARALEPQAVLSVVDRHAGAVSVTGEVGSAARFSLDPGGERVLGAIARAGGPRYPAYEITVTLQRGGATQRALLSEIMSDSRQNVALRPGDGVYLAHTPRYFLAFGATGPGQSIGLVNRRFAFDDAHLTLADALAKAGGLEDDRANAQAIFVYRLVHAQPVVAPPSVLRASGADPASPAAADAVDEPTVPTIYMLDLTRPDGYFLANQFRIHNEDTLFVSNSPSSDVGKFLALVLPLAYSASGFNAGFH